MIGQGIGTITKSKRCVKRTFGFVSCLFILVCLIGCSPPEVDDVLLSVNVVDDDTQSDNLLFDPVVEVDVNSIDYLKSLYTGSSTYISQDIYIEGVVTANDAYGEFPNSIVIEESSGAIELKCDLDSSSELFPIGSYVAVACSGLWMGATGGVLSLGLAPSGDYAVDYMERADIDLRVRRYSDWNYIPVPTSVTIAGLTANHISRFVAIADLEFVVEDGDITTFCSRDEESGFTQYTTHLLRDKYGNEIDLEVHRQVIYADEPLPTELTTLCAIVEYFNGEYRLRITNCGYL